MKYLKFGEETVVIRVPKSRRQEVLDFIKNFEVITAKNPVINIQLANQLAFKSGFQRGFIEGERFHLVQQVTLANGSDDDVKSAIRLFNNRLPSCTHSAVLDRLLNLILSSKLDLPSQTISFHKLLGIPLPDFGG